MAWQPRGSASYIVYTLLSRAYLTFTIAIFAAFGAQDMAAYGYAILTGVVLDAVRNMLAGDLTTNPARFRQEIASAATCRPQGLQPMILSGLMYGFFILYFLTIIVLESSLNRGSLQQYFDFFAPLVDAISRVVPVIERHATDLGAAGYGSRISITEHLHAASIVFLIGSVWMNSLLTKRYLIFGAADTPALIPPFRQKIIKIWLGGYLVCLSLYLYHMHVFPIGFGTSGPYSWSIHKFNAPFMYLPSWVFLISMCLSVSCLGIARLRNTAIPLFTRS
jgi:hypothetical protein